MEENDKIEVREFTLEEKIKLVNDMIAYYKYTTECLDLSCMCSFIYVYYFKDYDKRPAFDLFCGIMEFVFPEFIKMKPEGKHINNYWFVAKDKLSRLIFCRELKEKLTQQNN